MFLIKWILGQQEQDNHDKDVKEFVPLKLCHDIGRLKYSSDAESILARGQNGKDNAIFSRLKRKKEYNLWIGKNNLMSKDQEVDAAEVIKKRRRIRRGASATDKKNPQSKDQKGGAAGDTKKLQGKRRGVAAKGDADGGDSPGGQPVSGDPDDGDAPGGQNEKDNAIFSRLKRKREHNLWIGKNNLMSKDQEADAAEVIKKRRKIRRGASATSKKNPQSKDQKGGAAGDTKKLQGKRRGVAATGDSDGGDSPGGQPDSGDPDDGDAPGGHLSVRVGP